MLITNFAAGELSENLFGRIDIPQYYQGVSRLENFDVIPTGGIMKRNGTKRVLQMDENGRLIPFILDRENHCLLYLTPGKIRIYLNGVLESTAVSTDTVPLFATLEEINEVQYAQNYRTMVMVHENYAPIKVYYVETEGQKLFISILPINYNVTINSPDTIDKSPYNEDDKTYSGTGYLTSNFNYPRSVSFFQGRLVFGGTKNNAQRIFASKSDDINSFSTYKKYLTENKEYISILCTITNGSNLITLDNPNEGLKFTAALSAYIIDSDFFVSGTRINSLRGSQGGTALIATNPAIIENGLSPEESAQLDALVNAFNFANSNKASRVLGTVYYSAGQTGGPTENIVFHYGSSQGYLTVSRWPSGEWNLPFTLPADIASYSNIELFLLNYIHNRVLELIDLIGKTNTVINYTVTDIIANILWRDIILNTMRFKFRSNDYNYFNDANVIKQQIINITSGGVSVYIPIYTSKIIEDRYPTPDDGFTFEIASDMSDSIRWIGQNKNLLIGTETAEWIVPAGTNATNVQAILNSRYGSDKIQATSIGDAMCFFQSGKKGLVEYYIPQQDNNFRANNMAMLSKNMLHESPAFDFDFISAPYTKIFVSREDGIVVSLLYERSTGTFAWGRIITNGKIESVATLPGQSGFDDVYLIVERQGLYYLELLQEREHVYLDSHRLWDGDASGYNNFAVVYDETDNKIYPTTQAPIGGHHMFIGYPFTALVRSMPVLANNQMKQNVIKSLTIRFYDSFMPKMKSIPNNVENTIPRAEPYTGVIQVPFPGVYDRDVHFELIHDKPTRCQILAVNAEAN